VHLGERVAKTVVSPMTPVSPRSENRKGAFLLVDIRKSNRPVKIRTRISRFKEKQGCVAYFEHTFEWLLIICECTVRV